MTRTGLRVVRPATAWAATVTVFMWASAVSAASYHSALDLLNPTNRLFYGISVAGSASHLIVGAPDADPFANGDQTGQAVVYDATTGAVLHVLDDPMPEVPPASSEYGIAVAAIGGSVMVGAPLTDLVANDAGAVYVYDAASGALQRTISNPDAALWSNFGWSMAVRGSDLVIGAPGSFYPGLTSPGAVYLIDPSNGATLRSYTPLVPQSAFGFAVAVAGSNIVVGAPYDSTLGDTVGAAYLIDGDTGAVLQSFANPDPDAFDGFGWAVAAVGNTLLIGAYGDDNAATDGGAVYQFDATTGALLHTFTEPTPGFNHGFGYAIASLGTDVVIGNFRGHRAYLFDGVSGALEFTFTPPIDPNQRVDDYGFGSTLAVVGDQVFVGAPYEEVGPNQGSAYLFDPCGNGVRTVREHCDDGNTVGGDGCPATCSFCEAGPDAGCRAAGAGLSFLGLKRPGTDRNKDQLKWKWKARTGTLPADLGDPTAGDRYALCVYDRTDATPRLRDDLVMADGTCAGQPCWSPLGGGGFKHGNKDRLPSGIKRATLKAKASGAATLVVKGKGQRLSLDALPVEGPVRVELHRAGAAHVCWGANYSQPDSNGTTVYQGHSD